MKTELEKIKEFNTGLETQIQNFRVRSFSRVLAMSQTLSKADKTQENKDRVTQD
jgi:hypothetical protein